MKRVLVSHSWAHPESVERLRKVLDQSGYEYYDHSISSSEPLTVAPSLLKEVLASRIARVSTIVCVITPDAHKRRHVRFELEEAIRQGKRVIGVLPDTAIRKTVPNIIHLRANAIVGDSGTDLINAINGHDARHLPEYLIAENEDAKLAISWITCGISGLIVVGCLAADTALSFVQVMFEKLGYSIIVTSQLPNTEHVLYDSATGVYFAALVGSYFRVRNLLPILLSGAAAKALYGILSHLMVLSN